MVSYTDSETADCGGAKTITRTWTAVDACESDAPTARCRVRGGGTYGSATQWACNRVEDQMGVDRLDPDNRTVGIRCCRDPD